jgi:predicted lipoprotein with Yx(FWY)xxD motif
MNSRNTMAAAIIVVAGFAAACSGAATATPAASTSAASTSAAAPAASAPAAASGAPAAGGPVIMTATVGTQGTLVVASANGMTVYTFTKDVANSGTSACTGGCLTKWPAVTVPAGSTAAGASSVTGKIGTITRTDDGTLQVTYNGLPLYFYSGDKAAGDANGIYTGWAAVKP